MSIEQTHIVITGAASGIGKAMAEHFTARGMHVALLDRNQQQLDKLAQDLPNSLPICVDIADETQVDACFERIMSQFGKIDMLLNNAGVLNDGLLLKVKDGKVVNRLSVSAWQSTLDVNLTGTFLCGRAAASHMATNGGGVIINVSSVARAGNKGQTAYSASKAGVVALTATWAAELCDYGIRVAAIAPGFVDTPMIQQMRPDMLEMMVSKVPVKRVAKLAEMADAITFIMENDYFNGKILELDGGLRF
ncbi:SDR family oxidoreductase [Alteromonas sediminis]|uniref:SDR family oxidoreductase n=1 Tax=Alteromonas sediminis TaxID=2259342 RepID=A0A3N5Z612_9ALTE|nr:SDR family oxidoreductase [Alteromonas sediminis]RPJ65884.1 SDR family oxidoreductase [Alteromonas sediminis]